MTDEHLIAKRLAFIEQMVSELRRNARLDLIASDVREERFVEHTLQLAIQAVLDVAFHIVSDQRLGEPRKNSEVFSLLLRAGWLDPELAESLRKAVGFRNVLVHAYIEVDLEIVKLTAATRLDDLLQFVAAVRARLPPSPGT